MGVRAVNIQVGDDVAVAFKGTEVSPVTSAVVESIADWLPTGPVVPVGVACVGPAVAIGVKVQMGSQFVPSASDS